MTVALFGLIACVCLLALMVISDHLRKLVLIGERIATALEVKADPIGKMIGALKDIKATADAEVARRKEAEKPMLSPADSEKEYARRRAALLSESLKARPSRTVQ